MKRSNKFQIKKRLCEAHELNNPETFASGLYGYADQPIQQTMFKIMVHQHVGFRFLIKTE